MADGLKFKCAACGREFRWKPELAGKKAKCKCGATVQVPAADPAAAPPPPPPPAEAESFDDVYALAAAEAEQAAATNQAHAAPIAYAAPPPPVPQTTYTPSGAPIPKRAKWDNTPSTFERWSQVWRGLGYALLGLLFCAYAYYEFWALGSRRRHRMWILIWILYMIGGRWAVLVVIGGMGLLMVLVGVLAVFGKANIESDD